MSLHVSPPRESLSGRGSAANAVSVQRADDRTGGRLRSFWTDLSGVVTAGTLRADTLKATPPNATPSQALGNAPASDPVVLELTRALEAAERSSDAFAGLYADAVRLAVVARILSLPPRPAYEPEGAPEPDRPEPRRSGPGLPKWRLKRVLAFIDDHLDEAVSLADMAAAAGLSRMHFAAQFRAATGQRPHEYLLRRRIARAQELLRETCDPLVQIALAVGFRTQAHFTTVFRRFVGDTPYQWRCANSAR